MPQEESWEASWYLRWDKIHYEEEIFAYKELYQRLQILSQGIWHDQRVDVFS
jgi:hypothetical protein